MKKSVVWIVLLLVVAGGGGYYWYRRSSRPPEVVYKTAPVERRNVSARMTASGTLQARVTVQVGSQVSGRVLELFADFNSRVKKGDIVAKLDPQLYEASVAQARASFASAQANTAKAQATALDANRQYERVKSQRVEGLASQQEVDTAQTAAAVAKASVDAAKSSIEQARAQLHQDEVNLALTIIKSPIDGVVISRNVDVGQTVAASLQAPVLFTIAEDLTKMRVEASVPESDVGRLQNDMPAQFTVDAFPGQRFRGVIEQVRNAAATLQNVVTYTAIVAVDNAELKLRPGMTATVTVVTAKRDSVLAIPNAALRFKPAMAASATGRAGAAPSGSAGWSGRKKAEGDDAPEQKLVYKLSGTTAAPVKVTLGITDGSYTEVLGETLKQGDPVIVEGPPPEGGATPAKAGAGAGATRARGLF